MLLKLETILMLQKGQTEAQLLVYQQLILTELKKLSSSSSVSSILIPRNHRVNEMFFGLEQKQVSLF